MHVLGFLSMWLLKMHTTSRLKSPFWTVSVLDPRMQKITALCRGGVYLSCFVACVATIHVVFSRCVHTLYPDQFFGGGGKSQPVTEESKERQLTSCREDCKQQARGL